MSRCCRMTRPTFKRRFWISHYEVKGISNHYLHIYADYVLQKKYYQFVPEVLEELEKLPPVVNEPHLSSSWMVYDDFLTNYGSHVLVGGVQGSRLETFSMASSKVQYTEKDFKIKSCLDLEGPLPLNFSASICAQYTKEEREEAKSLDITSRLKIFGGDPGTRSELMIGRTSELIQKFLNEYNQSDTPVIYYYRPIWELIYAMFEYGSKEFLIGKNMEAYYQGFQGFRCDYYTDGDTELRKFVYDGDRYVCQRPEDGCQTNDDCGWILWGSQCGCGGNSCIDSDDPETEKYGRDYAHVKHKISGGHSEGINSGCQYHVGVYCACNNQHRDEKCVIWDQNLTPPTPPRNTCHPFSAKKE